MTPAAFDQAELAAVALAALRAAFRRGHRDGGRPTPAALAAEHWLAELAQPGTTRAVPSAVPQVAGAGPTLRTSQVDVAVAAAALGISDRAVRKRIRAGTLAARKCAGVWLIDMEGASTGG